MIRGNSAEKCKVTQLSPFSVSGVTSEKSESAITAGLALLQIPLVVGARNPPRGGCSKVSQGDSG